MQRPQCSPWHQAHPKASLALTEQHCSPSSLPCHCSVTKPKEIGSCNQDPPSKPCWASAPRVKPPPSSQAQPTSSARGAAPDRGAVSDPQVIGGSCQAIPSWRHGCIGPGCAVPHGMDPAWQGGVPGQCQTLCWLFGLATAHGVRWTGWGWLGGSNAGLGSRSVWEWRINTPSTGAQCWAHSR